MLRDSGISNLLFLRSLLAVFLAFINISSKSQVIISEINISGNYKTRDYIIERELLIKKGEAIDPATFPEQIKQSRNNLLNTSLFNFVEIKFKTDSVAENIVLFIIVTERWYLWPIPVFELADRNFNSWYQTADLTRVNLGLNTQWRNVSGNWDELDLLTQFGKNRVLALDYTFPYLNKAKTLGAGIVISESGKREIVTEIIEDKQIRSFSGKSLENSFGITARLTYRQNFYVTHLLNVGYDHTRFEKDLLELDSVSPEFRLYNANSLTAYYKVKLDHRDIKYYPLEGWYTDIELSGSVPVQYNNTAGNFLWFKSTNRYFKPMGNRFYSGISFTLKHTLGNEPFQLRQCLGYGRDFVRGYEYYVVDGKGFALLKTNLKFALIPERYHNISFIPWNKFNKIHFASYLNIFADAAQTWSDFENLNTRNNLPKKLLIGYGAGIDLVSYYDLVLRLEFSINRMNEKGLFFHMISGI